MTTENFKQFLNENQHTLCENTLIDAAFINCCNKYGIFTQHQKETMLLQGAHYYKADDFYTTLRTKGSKAPIMLYKVAQESLNHTLVETIQNLYPKYNLSIDENSDSNCNPSVVRPVLVQSIHQSREGQSTSQPVSVPENYLAHYGDPEASGLALIIPIKNYEKPLSYRYGSSSDVTAMICALRRFDICVYFPQNQETIVQQEEIYDWITEYKMKFNKDKHKFSFVIVFAHGDETDVLYDSRCRKMSIRKNIFDPFNNINFNVMAERPKIFILQCCRGNELVVPATVNRMDGIEQPEVLTPVPTTVRIAGVTDFLIFWSTIPGACSLRNKLTGSKFIQETSNVLQKYADDLRDDPRVLKEFSDLLQEINSKFREAVQQVEVPTGVGSDYRVEEATQCPQLILTLFGKFYLNIDGQSQYRIHQARSQVGF